MNKIYINIVNNKNNKRFELKFEKKDKNYLIIFMIY